MDKELIVKETAAILVDEYCEAYSVSCGNSLYVEYSLRNDCIEDVSMMMKAGVYELPFIITLEDLNTIIDVVKGYANANP